MSLYYTLIFGLAPVLGLFLTVSLLLLPKDAVAQAMVYAFSNPTEGGLGYGLSYLRLPLLGGIFQDSGALTIIFMLYIPVLYLWHFNGRLGNKNEEKIGQALTLLEINKKVDDCQQYLSDASLTGPATCGSKSKKKMLRQTSEMMQTVTGINLIKPYLERMWKAESWQWLWKRQTRYGRLFDYQGASDAPASSLEDSRAEEEQVRVQLLWSIWNYVVSWSLWASTWGISNSCDILKSQGSILHFGETKYHNVLKKYNRRLNLYRRLPLRTTSRLWGQFNKLELPVWLRPFAFRLYCWMFSCVLEEAANQDLKHYRNLSEFFRRSLKPGVRPVDDSLLTSPADGTVLHLGRVTDGALEQVKGISYSLRGFLGPQEGFHPTRLVNKPSVINKSLSVATLGSCVDRAGLLSRTSHDDSELDMEGTEEVYLRQLLIIPENQLYQCVIYLAPGDYHHFHSPTDWTVFARRHFPGELFSVNPGVARWLQGLFNFNERAVYVGKWQHGFFSMTAVGATNVGSINVPFDKELQTNTTSKVDFGTYHDAIFTTRKKNYIPMKKGEEFGDFNLGSTIVLVFEAPPNFKFNVKPGQKLKYGQGIGKCYKKPKT